MIGAYNYWNANPPPNDNTRNCVYLDSATGFTWHVGDCDAMRGYICQEGDFCKLKTMNLRLDYRCAEISEII